jgi:hypothetical protein
MYQKSTKSGIFQLFDVSFQLLERFSHQVSLEVVLVFLVSLFAGLFGVCRYAQYNSRSPGRESNTLPE